MLYEVTAIMPAYNAEKYIEAAILSVLQQTIESKLIIVNDASTDNTYVIAKKYQDNYPEQIKVINKTRNEGVSAARNMAVQLADTEYVAFLDADDWWSRDKLEVQLEKLKATGACACFSARELVKEDGESYGKTIPVPEEVEFSQLLKGNVIPCSSVVMKRDEAIQYPMEHDELHEDYIVWLSMLRDGKKIVGVNRPFLKSRMAQGGKSRNKWKSAKMTYQVYRYMGFSVLESLWYFMNYAVNGVKKYR